MTGVFEAAYDTCVRGYHVYQDVWVPVMDEMFSCFREDGNPHDPFAMKVTKAGITVGHLPNKISSTCSLFILDGGSISCKVMNPHRRYSSDLVQGGLEIPCTITLQGTKDLTDKARKLLSIKKLASKKQMVPSIVTPAPDGKKIKLEDDVDQSVWVTFTGTRIQLFAEDRHIIEEQERLTGRHINFTQALLRTQFPLIDGLQNTLLQDRCRFSVASKVVQILRIRNNHWVVISNLQSNGNKVSVYDTVYDDIDCSTLGLLDSMFEEEADFSIVGQLQKQQGDVVDKAIQPFP